MKDEISEVFSYVQTLINLTARHLIYSIEDDVSLLKDLKKFFKELEEACSKVKLEGLSKEDLMILGWGCWDDSGLMLAPLYWHKALTQSKRLILTGISGKQFVVGGKEEIDKDSRFGCLAYGIIPGEVEYVPILPAED